jgi:hypothetical protein
LKANVTLRADALVLGETSGFHGGGLNHQGTIIALMIETASTSETSVNFY